MSFFRIRLWAATVTLPLCWLYAGSHRPMIYAPSLSVIAGGFLFGIGAAINGGCAFGTLIRFAAGDLSFIASFIGMAVGIWSQRLALVLTAPFPSAPSVLAYSSRFGFLVLGLAVFFCIRELKLLSEWKGAGSRSPEQAAVVIGLCGGALCALRCWPYTVAFSQLVEGSGPEQVHGLELAAITFASLAAATIGATRNNPFHLNFQWRLLPRMPRNRRRVR